MRSSRTANSSAHTLLPSLNGAPPPAIVENTQAFGNNAVNFAPKILGQLRVETANDFGAPEIQKLAAGVRHLVATKVINAVRFGAVEARLFTAVLVAQAKVENSSSSVLRRCTLRPSR